MMNISISESLKDLGNPTLQFFSKWSEFSGEKLGLIFPLSSLFLIWFYMTFSIYTYWMIEKQKKKSNNNKGQINKR